MKKLIVIFLSFSLLFQSFIPGIISPIRTAQAASLSTSIFPSSLGGISKIQTSTRVDSACFVNVKEFVAAAYANSTRSKILGVSVSRYDSSSKAESIARNCIVMTKAQFGSAITWQATKNTTVSGYKSFFTKAYMPAESAYAGILYTIVQEYLIANVVLSQSSVSESYLKGINTVMVGKIPKTAKKSDGESCKTATECLSGHCYNGYCCQSGKKCCRTSGNCPSGWRCDTSKDYCIEKKKDGESCQQGSDCKSNYCGAYKGARICCYKSDLGCCKTNSDCVINGYCYSYRCVIKKAPSATCKNNYECLSGICESGKCQKKSEPAPPSPPPSPPPVDKTRDGVCDWGEDCTSSDCEGNLTCWIEWGCDWGGRDARTAVGCIASIAADLHIVAKVADIVQNLGCGVVGDFVVGVVTQNMEKVISAVTNLVYTAWSIVKLKVSIIAKFIFNVLVCIDNYFGISIWFWMELVPKIVGILSEVTNQAATAVGLTSPANLLVTDKSGGMVGVDQYGNKHETDSGFYIEFPKADFKLVVMTDTKGKDFNVQTSATKAGEIDVVVFRAEGKGEVEKLEYNDIEQDKDTTTLLPVKSKVGETPGIMMVTDAKGITKAEAVDKVSKETITVASKYKTRGFGNLFVYILVAIGAALVSAGAYILKKKKKGQQK